MSISFRAFQQISFYINYLSLRVWPRHRWPCHCSEISWISMKTNGSARGFSLMEMMFVLGISAVVGAVAVPMTGGSLNYFRLSGDARGVSNTVAVAKMQAAAHFTKARVFVNLADSKYRTE